MHAPPSTAYRIVNVPQPYGDVIARHGVQGKFVSSDENESPWVPFGANAAIRHLAFDVRRDIRWYINHYESYCREHGLPINEQLYL